MKSFKSTSEKMNKNITWQLSCLIALIILPLLLILSLDPISQDAQYHHFTDSRRYILIPNFFNVLSNLPFFFIGLYGYKYCNKTRAQSNNSAWLIMFLGIALISLGSSYYHWQPSYNTLFWDRLPMVISFNALFIAILSEYVTNKIASSLLPTVLLGISSVLYWYFTDDLRLYYWIQLASLLTVPAVMFLFKSIYSHQWLMLLALGFYILAKITEFYDEQVFQWTNQVLSGHSIKHLLAASGCYCVLIMLKIRTRRINDKAM